MFPSFSEGLNVADISHTTIIIAFTYYQFFRIAQGTNSSLHLSRKNGAVPTSSGQPFQAFRSFDGPEYAIRSDGVVNTPGRATFYLKVLHTHRFLCPFFIHAKSGLYANACCKLGPKRLTLHSPVDNFFSRLIYISCHPSMHSASRARPSGFHDRLAASRQLLVPLYQNADIVSVADLVILADEEYLGRFSINYRSLYTRDYSPGGVCCSS